jgi:serine/threonine-protein kinase
VASKRESEAPEEPIAKAQVGDEPPSFDAAVTALPPSPAEPPPTGDPGLTATHQPLLTKHEAGSTGELAARFATWDRYEIVEALGEGGMGAVYKARDRRLGRTVALKFILGAHPNLVLRFLQEARAQARIDHPNICRVYEVGQVDGRAYIAMQLVNGIDLSAAAPRMSLDQQVAAMRDIALAIHEAHKLGIVHRDLKPANILVEQKEDGRWFPLLMDFGLARELTAEEGLTESGALLGTPAYMSPEQARGELRVVDRRSDVYGLGATFYEVLAGRPPFANASLAATLHDVLFREPTAPRRFASQLPVDIETVVLTCLAKEPARRYASARALADDLNRYLDGQPIVARRASLWHRLRLRARRQRALTVVSACSLALVATLAVLGAQAWLTSRRERARSAERARLAERLGQDVNEIEWLLSSAQQLPLHDTTPERERIRARMRKIASTQHDLGALGDAAIHSALGRGHLVLHDWQKAEDDLARAEAAGLDDPGLHRARARALGELYHRALEEARHSGDHGWLVRREEELRRQYLTPALAELARSRLPGDVDEDTGAIEASLALYRRDYGLAEERALQAVARTPWLLEAHKIAADAAFAAGAGNMDRGSYDAARLDFERAIRLYGEAAEVARSDASVYKAAAEAWLDRAEIDFRQGQSPKAALEHGLSAVAQALRADPKHAPAYTTKAYLLLRWYRTPSLRTGDQRPFLDEVAGAAGRATELDPQDADAWDALGGVHVNRGAYEARHGGDPLSWWDRALAEINKALALQPNHPWANNDLGVLHRWIGDRKAASGRDPLPELNAAIRSYERATTIDPEYVFALANQADVHAVIAGHRALAGADPAEEVASARRAAERCLAIDPNFYAALNHVAAAELSLAHYLIDAGRDPAQPLLRAREVLSRALQIHPGHMTAYFHRIVAANEDARYLLQKGADPSGALADGRVALVEALRLNADCAYCFSEAARAELIEATAVARRGRGGARQLDLAIKDAERAAALDPSFAGAKQVAAETYLQRASISRGDPAQAFVREGLAYADATLAINPGSAEAHVVHAALMMRQAASLPDAAQRRPAIEAARDEAERAFSINPLLQSEWKARLEELY